MEQPIEQMLDMMVQPGFCVRNGRIALANPAARGLLAEPGDEVLPLLATGQEEYAAFAGGCLYLSVQLGGRCRGASVTRMEDWDVFLIDEEPESRELNALALAAQNLRGPIGSMLLTAGEISRDPSLKNQSGRLNRGLNQLLRIVNNMSDALMYASVSQKELVNLTAVFDEIFEKAQTLLAKAGITLHYEGPEEDLMGLADVQQLERAVLNVLANGAKFQSGGGAISAKLTRKGSRLRLSIEDNGPGIPDEILNQVFRRYLRQPALEDGRFGLGLGMVLIRTAAANHGGAVLIDNPKGARITMTLTLDQSEDTALHSPVLMVDYAGGWDHALMELSGVLPPELYEKN